MSLTALPVDELKQRIRSGRMLDAWDLAKGTGLPLAEWPAGRERRIAATLARNLGASRLGQFLDWRNWREDRQHPRWYFRALFGRLRFTPEAALIPEIEVFLEAHPEVEAGTRSDILAFLGSLYAALHDNTPASRLISEALDLQPEEPWIHVQQSSIHEMADRYQEALEASSKALRMGPAYHVAVVQHTDMLIHLGRDDDAIELLRNADREAQNPAFAIRLQALYSEREDHEQALWCMDRVDELTPLREKSLVAWSAGRRADFHFMAGRIDACLEWCDRKVQVLEKQAGFHKRIADSLRKKDASDRKRVRLEVPFVRQHRSTCAPATLAALASFWNRPHEHLAIAEAICHDGTPWHKERRWAEDHGFTTREFRLTRESLHGLIDRGVPFTLTTQGVTNSHLQACIGYDDHTGVVILRDPTERHFGEFLLKDLIEGHLIGGPRAMVMIPVEESKRLEGVFLPDEQAYNAYHELLVALDGNDRWQIDTALSTIRAVAPGSPLVPLAEERVSNWREDWPGQLAAIEAMLEIAPDHQPSWLSKAYALRNLGRWQDLREFLEDVVARPDADPVFTSELGELLMEDARLLPRAEHYLRRAVHWRRREARVHESLARCLTKQHRHEESIRLRRISSCLAPAFEPYASGFFEACRVVRRTTDGIDFLRERTRHSGQRDGGPWITLAACLNRINRDHDAVAVLEQGIEARPDDGDLRLQAGSMMTAWGKQHRARGLEWIENARPMVSDRVWLRESMRTATHLGDRARAIRFCRSLIDLQPRSIEAWRVLTRNTAEENGEAAAITLLDRATARHPDWIQLWALKAEWLVGTKRGPLESLDRVVELDPDDAWARRERASHRSEAGDGEGAERDARESIALDPWSAASRGICASVLEKLGRTVEATELLREALRLSIDYQFAAKQLIRLAKGREEKLAAIRFIRSEMNRQVSNGEVVPVYQFLAWPLIDPPDLLEELRGFCGERPDLWQTWAARIEQALRMRLDEEALDAATQLTESFPLLPAAWLELARVHRASGRHEDEENATARAVDLSPGWDEAARDYAQVLEIRGRVEEAIVVLKRACQLDPLNGPNHGCLADVQRRAGKPEEALRTLREAIGFCPFYSWGWTTACRWETENGATGQMASSLRDAENRYEHDLRWWRIAAEAWSALGEKEDELRAIRSGLRLDPIDDALRDQLAFSLWSDRRFDEALAACDTVEGETRPPVNLRGRRAWILMHTTQPLAGVAEMKALVEEEPEYAWGLSELADWYRERGQWEDLRDLCIRWQRASPDDARVLGTLGLAEVNLKNESAARQAFGRAHAIEPDYSFAGRHLLELQMEAKDFDSAAETLARLEHYSPGPHVIGDGIDLDLRRSDPEAALRRAGALFDDPESDDNLFRWIDELFFRHGHYREWKELLERRAEAGPLAAPGALCALLRTLPAESVLKKSRKWMKLAPEGSEARIIAWEFLITHATKQTDTQTIGRWARHRPAELRHSGRLWNAVGEALLEVGDAGQGVRWLDDWRERPDDVEPETLLNLAALHDGAPGDEDASWAAAREIRRHAIERFPADTPVAQALRAGHALHLAVDGNTGQAGVVLAEFEPERTSDYYVALGNCAHAVVAAAEGDEEQSRNRLRKALTHLSEFTDIGSVRLRKRTEQAVANAVPWAKRKVRRLRKSWYPYITPASRGFLPWITQHLGSSVWFFIIAGYLILRACTRLAGD